MSRTERGGMQDIRAAIYTRYSGDRQRETSIDDQVRNCTRQCQRDGVAITKTYVDKAVSGAVAARPGYQRMQADARDGLFDVLYVDDLSRLSRDDYEMKGVLRKLAWQRVRVVGVTDGYDSGRKGHKIHAGFKGLMNEIFLDDLRERTHRGMTGQAMKGYNCGGRTYGYQNVPIEDESRKDAYGRPTVLAVQYEVDQAQADIVRQIHGWYATGYSYKWIASELNRRGVPSSRGGTWALTAVKVILENEMYEGRLIWNRRAWVKNPETGKRTYRKRPPEEWIVAENPALRVVPHDVIEKVRRRQAGNRSTHLATFHAAPAQRYLFSGLMVCAECDSSFVIVAGNRYGCASHKTRGAAVCGNSITVSRHIIEERILRGVKDRLREPTSLEKFKGEVAALIEQHNSAVRNGDLARQLREAERVCENILAAIKQGIITEGTKSALENAEAEVAALAEQARRAEQWKVPAVLPRAVEQYRETVEQLESRLAGHVGPAREVLKSLLGDRIRIHRQGDSLTAEIPNGAFAALSTAVNRQFDSGGCGREQRSVSTLNFLGCGDGIRSESDKLLAPTFISLGPSREDSVPLKHRHRKDKDQVQRTSRASRS